MAGFLAVLSLPPIPSRTFLPSPDYLAGVDVFYLFSTPPPLKNAESAHADFLGKWSSAKLLPLLFHMFVLLLPSRTSSTTLHPLPTLSLQLLLCPSCIQIALIFIIGFNSIWWDVARLRGMWDHSYMFQTKQ